MSRQRRSPVQKARRAALAEVERAQPVTSDTKLERCVQVLKLIDIKRRIIGECAFRIPLAIGGLVIVGVPFAIVIVMGSLIGTFIVGSIWSAVLSQLVGPFGAYTKRKSARQDVDVLRTELVDLVGELGEAEVFVFAVTGASKADIATKGPPRKLDRSLAMAVDADGDFPFTPYKYLGIAFMRENASEPVFSDSKIRHLDWVSFARSKGASDEVLTRFVSAAPHARKRSPV